MNNEPVPSSRSSSFYTLVALCAVGAEKLVSHELKKLGLTVISTGFGAVRFTADIAAAYRSLMALRVADRILLETARFPAENFDDLFDGVQAVPWEMYLAQDSGLMVTKVRIKQSRLHSETSVQAITHKAAADRLCKKYRRSRLNEEGNKALLRLYLEKNLVTVLLDLSGDPLFKRGYRLEGGNAPLRETTAAALILLSGWRRKFPLCDPLCGSGTLIIEAALFAWDAAPGLGRRFALSDLLIADPALEKSVREDLLQKVDFSRTMRLCASDADARAVSLAQSNLVRAYRIAQGQAPEPGIQKLPSLPFLPVCTTCRMQDALPSHNERGFIITNPPYGKRLGERADAETGYRNMAALARNFSGWKLALISDHPGFESFFGRTADSCREIINGASPVYFYQYEHL
ncbi:MAG: class I SAM-dependent RNA methyltransferase [Spirochaetaceae bacterium]|jgi:putative N6-adenine-specific DNA methylase|nr:class I SAM-dependent RNA methyltransferase [Spirochaetaceae bacterium]